MCYEKHKMSCGLGTISSKVGVEYVRDCFPQHLSFKDTV